MIWLGYLSSICLITCGLPLFLQAIKDKGISLNLFFFWLWYTGEVSGLIYACYINNGPMLLNYGFNSILLTVIGYYALFPRKVL